VALRSSHPEHGATTATRALLVRPEGAEFTWDLAEVSNRLDLNHLTRVSWFFSQLDGKAWIGGLRLEE
jgi:hypothetical protein